MADDDIFNDLPADVRNTLRELNLTTKESLTMLDYARLEQSGFGNSSNGAQTILKTETFLQGDKDFLVKYKLFNDPIYGNIEVHPVALAIIDTPQFQRLRHIRQLATLSYVYPGANGTRFDHSLGVYHLAGELVNSLRTKQPELGITKVDCLCVQLAGLCHDLGHGPFSHMFDTKVIPTLDSNRSWKHEENSLRMLDHIYQPVESSVRTEFRTWGLQDKDFEFIKSLIICQTDEEQTGRGNSKSFLYEIVANDVNGMDVDKWDYIVRDAMYLGIKINFECQRLLYHLRVIEVDGRHRICVRDKAVGSLFNLFRTRYSLHKNAYQHKVGRAVEMMVSEAIIKSAPHLRIGGKTLLECIDDMNAYTRLDDSIFFKILHSETEELRESREILERLQDRQIYKCVAEAKLEEDDQDSKETIKGKIEKELGGDFVVQFSTADFGKKGKNPLDLIRYYKKSGPNDALPLEDAQKSLLIPNQFQDRMISIFCKLKAVEKADFERANSVLQKYVKKE